LLLFLSRKKKAAGARSNCNPTERALHEKGRDSPADFIHNPSTLV